MFFVRPYYEAMPRIVDHEARRRQIAGSVERLVATDGIDGVTIARTAAQAGVSVGLVQHYFDSKDEMLLASFRQIRAGVDQRILTMRQRSEQAGARIEQMLVDGLAELLPLDAVRRREGRATLAFMARSFDNPELAATLRSGNRGVRAQISEALQNALECGELPEPVDYDREAGRLLATVDGLALHCHADRKAMPARTAHAALASEVARMLPGRCRRHD